MNILPYLGGIRSDFDSMECVLMRFRNRRAVLVVILVCVLTMNMGFSIILSSIADENNDGAPVVTTSNYQTIGIPHVPIRIDNNTGFNISNGVTKGNGSVNNPFIIENDEQISLKKYVHDTDLLTKFEGDSFMIAMQDFTDSEQITSLAKKCIDDFASQSVIVDHKTNQKLQKTICIGISVYPDDGTKLDDIFRNSDIALEEAKNRGRSSFEFYKEEQNSALDLF